MRFVSTRGKGRPVSAAQAILAGAAPDGGLYLMDSLPDLSGLLDGADSYPALAARVFEALLGWPAAEELQEIAHLAYGAAFEAPGITPLVAVGDAFVLELFHGPTAAFKDLALQALPRLMARARRELDPDTRYTVLAATSGDTGSAAMRGFAGLDGFSTLVFYPEGGVSPVQRAQMQSLSRGNARAVAIRGNFDDAQAAVKVAFARADDLLPPGHRLTSANSINIGRLAAQVVYYIQACRDLRRLGRLRPGQRADFIVPTGNFGNILAGWLAKRLGLPIGRLVCASNANRVLHDFLQSGLCDCRQALHKTLSPSMDILISSNLERLLFYAAGSDPQKTAALMEGLKQSGRFAADKGMMRFIRQDIGSAYAEDSQALEVMRLVWQQHRYLLDPHTACAWAAQPALDGSDNPRVVLATASPFKFPEAVFTALGQPLPENPADWLPALSRLTGLPLPRALNNLVLGDESADSGIEKAAIPESIRQWMGT